MLSGGVHLRDGCTQIGDGAHSLLQTRSVARPAVDVLRVSDPNVWSGRWRGSEGPLLTTSRKAKLWLRDNESRWLFSCQPRPGLGFLAGC